MILIRYHLLENNDVNAAFRRRVIKTLGFKYFLINKLIFENCIIEVVTNKPETTSLAPWESRSW